MKTKRYNAGIQRAKGFLEIAAGLYDTSLSWESRRAAEGVRQTDSRVGRRLRVSLDANDPAHDVSLSLATGSIREMLAVADREISLTWVNPSVLLTMACRGKGPFKKSLPLRAIAVFPSYDVMGFAVHESTGITSLEQIKKERIPLRLSTGHLPRSPRGVGATMFTVGAVLRAAGFSLDDLRKWGGTVHSAPRPSDPSRRAGIESDAINAVFDEGIKSWANTALENGFRFLPIEGAVLKKMRALGFRPTDMPDKVAYALCEAIKSRKQMIPTDNYKPLRIAQLCANDAEAPYDAPFHAGAKRYYRERGYLK